MNLHMRFAHDLGTYYPPRVPIRATKSERLWCGHDSFFPAAEPLLSDHNMQWVFANSEQICII
jgi:hypothetical protein